MKLVIYTKYSQGIGHIHAGIVTTFVFVPDKNVLLFVETQGSFGSEQYGIVNHEHKDVLLGEALLVERALYDGLTKMDGTINAGSKITDIREIYKLDEEIEDLITTALERHRLDLLVSNAIEELIS